MDKCPHCGSNMGLYSKEYVRFEQFYKFNGEPDGYSDWSDIRPPRKRVPLYCSKCHKYVADAIKLFA